MIRLSPLCWQTLLVRYFFLLRVPPNGQTTFQSIVISTNFSFRIPSGMRYSSHAPCVHIAVVDDIMRSNKMQKQITTTNDSNRLNIHPVEDRWDYDAGEVHGFFGSIIENIPASLFILATVVHVFGP